MNQAIVLDIDMRAVNSLYSEAHVKATETIIAKQHPVSPSANNRSAKSLTDYASVNNVEYQALPKRTSANLVGSKISAHLGFVY